MSKKRFTDTDIWKKLWFRKLVPAEKAAWSYIKDQCDNVGVWEPDYDIAEAYIGAPVDWDAFRERLNGNVEVLENGRWWITDFCLFQYGEKLNLNNNAHKSYLKLLTKHGIFLDLYETSQRLLTEGSDQTKEQDKEKDKDKDKEKEKKPIRKKPDSTDKSDEAISYWARYSSKHSSIGGNDYPAWFDKMWDAYPARGGKRVGKYLAFREMFSFVVAYDELQEVYNAICVYAKSCGDYAKDMHRFLKNDFWRDYLVAESWPEHLTAYKAKYSLDEAKQLYSEGTKP